MQLRQLEYLVALSRERHFARAAAACYVSQPALSASLTRLEDELGVSLINRGHSFAGFTPEGERLLSWARRVIAEHDSLKAEIGAGQAALTGTLMLGTGPSAVTTAAFPIEAFCAANPLASVKAATGLSGAELARRIREFELDAGVAVFDSSDLVDLEVRPLYEERYVLIASPELLPESAVSLSWQQAAGLPLALLSPVMRSREILDEAFEQNGLRIEPQLETDSFASLFAAVRTGRWASVVPHSRIQTLVSPWIRSIPLVEPTITATVLVAINAARPGSAIAQAFMRSASSLTAADWDTWVAGEPRAPAP
jgi:DNA-binding transcriptional LysR family regulator